jgi:predicted DNA-binding protein (UPF0251 family)
MLPDFPKLKEKLQKLLIARTKMVQSAYMNPLSDVPKARIFEGNRTILVREDGSVEEIEIKEMKAEMEINLKEIETITLPDILEKFDTTAKELAMQQSKVFYDEIGKAVEKVGNVIDIKGKSFSIDDFLKMLDMIWLDFDENGNPNFPTIVAGEKTFKSISEVLPQLETDQECKKRLAEIIERKREEWRARESNRKLVG